MKFSELLESTDNDKYVKDTKAYIKGLLKNAEGDSKEFLQGLYDFLDENGYLTSKQKQALGNITKEEN